MLRVGSCPTRPLPTHFRDTANISLRRRVRFSSRLSSVFVIPGKYRSLLQHYGPAVAGSYHPYPKNTFVMTQYDFVSFLAGCGLGEDFAEANVEPYFVQWMNEQCGIPIDTPPCPLRNTNPPGSIPTNDQLAVLQRLRQDVDTTYELCSSLRGFDPIPRPEEGYPIPSLAATPMSFGSTSRPKSSVCGVEGQSPFAEYRQKAVDDRSSEQCERGKCEGLGGQDNPRWSKPKNAAPLDERVLQSDKRKKEDGEGESVSEKRRKVDEEHDQRRYPISARRHSMMRRGSCGKGDRYHA